MDACAMGVVAIEDVPGVATACLGLVKRDIRIGEQLVDVVAVFGINHRADTGGHCDADFFFKRADAVHCVTAATRGVLDTLAIGLRQQNAELIPTEASDDVGLAQFATPCMADLL